MYKNEPESTKIEQNKHLDDLLKELGIHDMRLELTYKILAEKISNKQALFKFKPLDNRHCSHMCFKKHQTSNVHNNSRSGRELLV